MTNFSLDTNVFVALWDRSNALNIPARNSLDHARASGHLLVCAPVFGELMGHPSRNANEIESLFSATGLEVDWRIEEAIWRTAGSAFQAYVRRRVASSGSYPRRILTDFLIGAHAVIRGCTLLLNKKIYSAAFPMLDIESF